MGDIIHAGGYHTDIIHAQEIRQTPPSSLAVDKEILREIEVLYFALIPEKANASLFHARVLLAPDCIVKQKKLGCAEMFLKKSEARNAERNSLKIGENRNTKHGNRDAEWFHFS